MGQDIGDDRYEIEQLLPVLRSVRHKLFVDVGCHEGLIARFLAENGFSVLALDPAPQEECRSNIGHFIESGQVTLLKVAASDIDGVRDFWTGRYSGVSSLEQEWTTIAFPDLFDTKAPTVVEVRKLSTIFNDLQTPDVGFVKIDTEGHEDKVLSGLFDGAVRPDIVMFEANQRFPHKAQRCLQLLKSSGYRRFDMYMRYGVELLSYSTFNDTTLPREWYNHNDKYFYANIIAHK